MFSIGRRKVDSFKASDGVGILLVWGLLSGLNCIGCFAVQIIVVAFVRTCSLTEVLSYLNLDTLKIIQLAHSLLNHDLG